MIIYIDYILINKIDLEYYNKYSLSDLRTVRQKNNVKFNL